MTSPAWPAALSRAPRQEQRGARKAWQSLAWTLLAATLLAFASGHAAVLRWLVPLGSLILAGLLFQASPKLYLRFVFLVWMFSPLLRRLVDFQAGWQDPSSLLLVPYVVTLVGPALFAGRLLRMPLKEWFPFLLALFGVGCGLVGGVLANPLSAVVMGLLNWGAPVAFATLLYSDREHAAEYRAALPPLLPPVILAVSGYVILQFLFLFPWDAFWLIQMNTPSMGIAEPLAFRAFGPLNSAGPCAFALAMCLLASMQLRSLPVRVLLLTVGTAALLLTQVRAGWLVLLCGLLLHLVRDFKRTASLLTATSAVFLLLGAIGFSAGEASQVVGDRLRSFTTPGEDQSADSRKGGYAAALADMGEHPLGHGLGVPEDLFEIQGSFSLRDSGFVDAFITLGWLGACSYLAALLYLLCSLGAALWRSPTSASCGFGIPALALLCLLPLGSVGVTVSGWLLWTFGALALGAQSQPHAIRMSEPARSAGYQR